MSRSPKPGTTIFLYVFAIVLVITAIILLLKGTGVIGDLPNYVVWALVLISIGCGIIAGLKNFQR